MFPNTRWTLIQQVTLESSDDSKKALEELCQEYAQPVFGFVRRRISSHEEAEDVTQEFFAQLINGSLLERADQTQGRFRSFLLHAVRNFLADWHDRKQAVKRGGRVQHVTLEDTTPAAMTSVTPEQEFELQWVRTTLRSAILELETEYRETQRDELLDTLKGALDDTEKVSAREAGRKLRMTEAAVRVALHRLRKRLGQIIRQRIMDTVDNPENVDDEIQKLMQLLESNR